MGNRSINQSMEDFQKRLGYSSSWWKLRKPLTLSGPKFPQGEGIQFNYGFIKLTPSPMCKAPFQVFKIIKKKKKKPLDTDGDSFPSRRMVLKQPSCPASFSAVEQPSNSVTRAVPISVVRTQPGHRWINVCIIHWVQGTVPRGMANGAQPLISENRRGVRSAHRTHDHG